MRALVRAVLIAAAVAPLSFARAEPAGESPSPEAAAPSRRVIEEIVVTAQKVEQKLQDVPISMTVLDSSFLAEQGVTDFRDLSLLAGNFKINNEGGTLPPPDVRIRGFGTSEANRAFEQSVGLSIDGDTFGQQEYFQSALFDLERVEVLKGPQGTLFGKNTTAGLVNVVLAEPTEELAGFVDVQYGEIGRRRLEAAVGGPLLPNVVHFRLAGLSDERDGLVDNTTARTVAESNERLGGRDRKAVRAKLELPNVLGTRIRLTAERSDFEADGLGTEIVDVTEPAIQAFFEKYDPNVDTVPGNYVASVDHPHGSDRTIRRLAANATTEWRGWGFDAVAGHARLDIDDVTDVADLGPAPVGHGVAKDGGNQTTVELRAASPDFAGLLGLGHLFGLALGDSELTSGFFFQRKRVNTQTALSLRFPVFGEFTAASRGVPPPPGDAEANRDLPTNTTTSMFSQEGLSYAGFAQLAWRPAPRWTFEPGLRITQETKDADVKRFGDSAVSETLYQQIGLETFDIRGQHRSELGVTPRVALLFDVTDDVNAFATWAVGFKSGGFNENAISSNLENLKYEEETMTSWEVGSKARLLDGTATLNTQLFWMEAEDLQVYTIEPGVVLGNRKTTNAGKARSRGAEADATWLATDWLTVHGTFGFDDSEFVEFPFGTCEIDVMDADGDGDARCALDGEPLPFTPKWNGTVTTGVRAPLAWLGGWSLPVANDVEGVASLSVHYEDVQFVNRTDDPRTRQPSFFTVDLQIGFASPGRGWSLTVTGENLTDETTRFLKKTILVPGSFREINNPPRLWFGTLRWAF